MSKQNYPTANTIANALHRERRGVSWAKQSIEFAHQNLLAAASDIPDAPEYAEMRRAIYRALDRIRQARGALSTAYDVTTEAMLVAERSAPAYITNKRLLVRYQGQADNGAQMVQKARTERQRREDSYSERERWQREMERQRFLNNDRKPEGED